MLKTNSQDWNSESDCLSEPTQKAHLDQDPPSRGWSPFKLRTVVTTASSKFELSPLPFSGEISNSFRTAIAHLRLATQGFRQDRTDAVR